MVVENKTFDGGLDNMTPWYGSRIASTPATAKRGRSSLAISATGGYWGVIENWPGQASVRPGVTYTFKASVAAGSAPGSITEQANWVDANDNSLGTVTVGTVRDSKRGWTELTGTAKAPAGATHVALDFSSRSRSGAVTYLTDVTVTSAMQDPATTVGAAGHGKPRREHPKAVRDRAHGTLRSRPGSAGGR